jgi:hypothetical protein
MARVVERQAFVPARVRELASALDSTPWSSSEEQGLFQMFTRLVSALYHHEFHGREQAVIEAWDRMDRGASLGTAANATSTVTTELQRLLEDANYTRVSTAELDDALSRESLIPLRLEADFEIYDELLIYRRGSHRDTVEIPRWRGLRSTPRTITVDERVVVHARIRPASWFDEHDIEPRDRRVVPGQMSLKQFQNVPRADIEMLLPSTRVRFRPIDILLVGVPAVASGIAVLATKLLPTLGLVFLLVAAWLGFRDDRPTLDQTALVILFGGVVTLGGFLFRQWAKLKNRRVEYLKTLTENLYFRTLADGPGVIHTLLSSAEQQEVIEVVVAYRFLLTSPRGMTARELDAKVEEWLQATCQRQIDFDVDHAVAKLRALELVDGTRRLRSRTLVDAVAMLDRRWDDLFRSAPPCGNPIASASSSSRSDASAVERVRRWLHVGHRHDREIA